MFHPRRLPVTHRTAHRTDPRWGRRRQSGRHRSGLRQKNDLYTLNVSGGDRLSNWNHLDDQTYQLRRDAWLNAVTLRLDREWPGLAGAVVERDMATAKTMRRVLGTPGGAIGGFAPNTPGGIPRGVPLAPETNIEGLWLASAYSGMGGFDGAMAGGAAAARAALAELST